LEVMLQRFAEALLSERLLPWSMALIFSASLLYGCWGLDLEHYGIAYDEIAYWQSSRLYVEFARRVLSEGLQTLTVEELDACFKWNSGQVVHPTFSRLMSAISWAVLHRFIGIADEGFAFRFHNALAFALLCTAAFQWLRQSGGTAAAWAGVALLWGCTRFVGHAHLAQTDALLCVLWFMATRCWMLSHGPWRHNVLCGCVAGLALATKHTAGLLLVALVGVDILLSRWQGLRRAAVAALIAALTFYVLNPDYWMHPWDALLFDVRALVTRGQWNPLPSLVLGVVYPFHVPWYAPLVTVVAVTPPTTLAAGAVMLPLLTHQVFRRSSRKRADVILVTGTVVPLLAMMLPGAPGHDVDRLFLSFFPMLCVVAALGIARASAWLQAWFATLPVRHSVALAHTVVALLAVEPFIETVASHPHEITYFSPLVGGSRGAYVLGFEVFYFKNELTTSVIRDLDRHLPASVEVAADLAYPELVHWQREGLIKPSIRLINRPGGDLFVMYWRRGWMKKWERELGVLHTPVVRWDIDGLPFLALYDFR
jgi:hypothetical protein